MNKYIISIDAGSSSTRIAIVNEKGKIIKFFSKNLSIFCPKNSYFEHNPEELINDLHELLHEAFCFIEPSSVLGIGISNQRESVIVWDKNTGKSIYPCISWQDWRTEEYCREKNQEFEKIIKDKTGLSINSYFSASKINWILKNNKYNIDDLLCGTIDTWIIWNLTNKKNFVTDVTNASRTLLMNINNLEWDEELLKIFDIPKKILPNIKSSCDHFGSLIYKNYEIPILGVIGDQQSSLLASFNNDSVGICTYGTGAFILLHSQTKIVNIDKCFTTVAWKIKNEPVNYALEMSVMNCGNILNWLISNKFINNFDLPIDYGIEENFYFLPFLNNSYHFKDDSKYTSLLISSNYKTNSQDILASTYKGIALVIAELLEIIKQHININSLIVNGKMSDNNFFMQLQANYSNISLLKLESNELSALGAAYLVGIYCDIWNIHDISNLNQVVKKFQQQLNENKRISILNTWKKLLIHSQEIYKILSKN